MDNNREYWIDAVRSFACLCVIMTHAAIPNGSDGQYMVAIYNYFAVGGASILFFMISGALILNKERDTIPFMKKRVTRIVFPMVFWSLFFIGVKYLQGIFTAQEAIEKVIRIPFGPQVGVYWFIYVIFGIYMLTPILSVWLNRCSKKDLEIYLIIWGVTLFLPYLNIIDPRFLCLISYVRGYLYYFYGFIGFALLGHYLRRYANITIDQRKYLYLFIAIVAILPIVLYALSVPHDVVQDRLSINVVLLAICYFVILKHIHYSPKWSARLYDFAQHTFGIYLVHFYLMRDLIWSLFYSYNIHYAIQVPLIVIVTATLSYLIVHAISKLPFSKYIVGL